MSIINKLISFVRMKYVDFIRQAKMQKRARTVPVQSFKKLTEAKRGIKFIDKSCTRKIPAMKKILINT